MRLELPEQKAAVFAQQHGSDPLLAPLGGLLRQARERAKRDPVTLTGSGDALQCRLHIRVLGIAGNAIGL